MAGSLYIHVPFCMRKCVYCDFFSVPFDENRARSYAGALKREIGLRGGGRLGTVYMGGGTPTVLPASELEGILETIRSTFDLLPNAEVTVEANPGTVDREKAARLRKAGVNRLSLGVQSFDDGELKTLGRVHTAAEAADAIRSQGFENVSLDLIYAIPGQSVKSWESTLRQALRLSPRHISAYELTPEPGTPLMESLENGLLVLPEEDTVLEMASLALDALTGAGYRHYEVSNYAIPGWECRHNLNYWRRGEYLGVGPGAYSFSENRREKNTTDIEKYTALLSRNKLPVEETTAITSDEAQREFLFLGLRLSEGLDIAWFLSDLGLDLAGAAGGLVRGGMMEIAGGRLRMTRRGMMLFNPVVVKLMEALGI